MLTLRLKRNRRPAAYRRECPSHRKWVRSHHCSVPNCDRRPIECAHVRKETDGGMGIKPSDRWCVSLCNHHHAVQHQIGEQAFELQFQIELKAIAVEFFNRSPHRHELT